MARAEGDHCRSWKIWDVYVAGWGVLGIVWGSSSSIGPFLLTNLVCSGPLHGDADSGSDVDIHGQVDMGGDIGVDMEGQLDNVDTIDLPGQN